MGIAILVYQNLDNLDGKQARKTSNTLNKLESSSPLGMLFDHGADSLCSFLISIVML
jgi:ethanolaminephosphotransferase